MQVSGEDVAYHDAGPGLMKTFPYDFPPSSEEQEQSKPHTREWHASLMRMVCPLAFYLSSGLRTCPEGQEPERVCGQQE